MNERRTKARGPNGEPPHTPRRWQFTLRDMLLLAVACALISAAANAVGGPAGFRAGVAGYFLVLAAYGFLRMPQIVRQSAGYLRRLRELRQQREQWAEDAAERVRRAEEARQAEQPGRGQRGPFRREGRVQYRLIHLLGLTALVALVLGLAQLPWPVLAVPLAALAYLAILGVFLMVRGGRTRDELVGLWRDLKSLARDDDELAQEAAALRCKLEATRQAQPPESKQAPPEPPVEAG